MKFQYSDLQVCDLHTNSWKTLRSGTGSLTLLLHLVCIKVSARLAAALVPPHVLAQVLLTDHPAVHCPLVPRALVGEGSLGGDKKGETARLARELHCRCEQKPCTWGEGGPRSLPALESGWCSLYQNIRLLEELPSFPGHEWGVKTSSCCTYLSQRQTGLDEQNIQRFSPDLRPWTPTTVNGMEMNKPHTWQEHLRQTLWIWDGRVHIMEIKPHTRPGLIFQRSNVPHRLWRKTEKKWENKSLGTCH